VNKVITLQEAANKITNGCTLMIGGFVGCAVPEKLIDAIAKKHIKDITLISNDLGPTGEGPGLLVHNRQIKKAIVSFVSINREAREMERAGELEVELVPQGSLAEKIRAGGYGLGGVLTKTGLGTAVEEGKERVTVDNQPYLLERPLSADVAIVFAKKADTLGNLVFHGSASSHSMAMASAGDITIVEAEEIVEAGSIAPDTIHVPSAFVNYVVQGGIENAN